MNEDGVTATIGGYFRNSSESAVYFSQKADLRDYDFPVDFEPHIGHYEMLAATVAVDTFAQAGWLRGENVMHHVDNAGDIFQVVDGFSRDIVIQVMIDRYWDSCAKYDISPYIAFTSTKLNVADYLTRRDLTIKFNKACRWANDISDDGLLAVARWEQLFSRYKRYLGVHVTAEIIRRAAHVKANKTHTFKVSRGPSPAGDKKRVKKEN
jgi:hypothetical protein